MNTLKWNPVWSLLLAVLAALCGKRPMLVQALSRSSTRLNRRRALQTTSSWMITSTAVVLAPVVPTARASEKTIFLQGSVTLAPDAQVVVVESDSTATTTTGTNALYITCRPSRPDNVPSAILSGTRGKPPPVLAARFENPTFPFEFVLDEENVTPEGVGAWWWNNDDDLIVSARWDADGVAATRSPEDLVGRAILLHNNKNDAKTVHVQLQGRGAFGKFATKKS